MVISIYLPQSKDVAKNQQVFYIHKVLGRNIKNLRKKRKLTNEDLAFKADISTGYLSLIENGKCNTTVFTVKKIADVLEASVESLFKI